MRGQQTPRYVYRIENFLHRENKKGYYTVYDAAIPHRRYSAPPLFHDAANVTQYNALSIRYASVFTEVPHFLHYFLVGWLSLPAGKPFFSHLKANLQSLRLLLQEK
jgi:hypothetical protein